ncbi:MAG: non-canonical purine NTP pyrophosphatase, RdgB/HAM1 family [Deltaproteobacteria bacterium HGW-Deltaproteobacteria-24]|jgi:XTP/dITP diphosphohydrolase|nr:MAG: non-canonical purine NTP pyrophosphatase, RdgB/HAM1 family [Deltaproteobacteria bacterium HGW-Deltaproteobacteria-24]
MRIVLATSNQGKIKEFKELMPHDEVCAFEELLGKMEIEETGTTFKENAILKAKTVYDKLNDNHAIVISDDSGISVQALNNEPGVYSARYAGINANDKANNAKLMAKLNEANLSSTPAFYTACIAIVYQGEVYTVHGWMHGEVIDHERGSNGFGYDPMFIPNGYTQTLGELENEIKKTFSHRSQALQLAKKVLDVLIKEH